MSLYLIHCLDNGQQKADSSSFTVSEKIESLAPISLPLKKGGHMRMTHYPEHKEYQAATSKTVKKVSTLLNTVTQSIISKTDGEEFFELMI